MNKQIEEMIKDIKTIQPFFYGSLAEKLLELNYRKIPEGAVVLTTAERDEEMRLIREDVIERMKATRKETAEKFAERLKEKECWFITNDIEKDHFHEVVDEIVKELVDEDAKESE